MTPAPETLVGAASEVEPTSKAASVVRLYGRAYDAARWAAVHPGGRAVIESIAALKADASGHIAERLFESYHRDPKRNLLALEPFALGESEASDSPRCASATLRVVNGTDASSSSARDTHHHLHDPPRDAFGEDVRRAVYAHLRSRGSPRGEGGAWAVLKCAVAFLAWLGLVMDACRAARTTTTHASSSSSMREEFDDDDDDAAVAVLTRRTALLGVACRAALAGFVLITWGLIQFHDASHYAFAGGPEFNRFLTSSWSAVAYWAPWLWHRHHVELHHSCTGDYERDPDVRHGAPFMRKTAAAPKRRYLALHPAAQVAAVALVPGMYFGQTLHYATVRLGFRTNLWKMTDLVPTASFATTRWERALGWWLPAWFVALAWRSGSGALAVACVVAYMLGANVAYACNILPDHDTWTSHANAARFGETADTAAAAASSWTARQAAASANWAGPLWCCVFGGLNYQIEHHLFPRVHHSFYADIAPVVRAACARHNVPYVHYPSFVAAFAAVYDQLARVDALGDLLPDAAASSSSSSAK